MKGRGKGNFTDEGLQVVNQDRKLCLFRAIHQIERAYRCGRENGDKQGKSTNAPLNEQIEILQTVCVREKERREKGEPYLAFSWLSSNLGSQIAREKFR